MKCGKCGEPIEEGMEVCPGCGEASGQALEDKSKVDEFKVLYNIEDFDEYEENMIDEDNRHRRRLIIGCALAGIAFLIVLVCFVVKAMNIYTADGLEKDGLLIYEEENNSADEGAEPSVEASNSSVPAETSNNSEDLSELKEKVKRICSNYNNGQTPYEGELIGVVNDSNNIMVTYLIPAVVSVEERDDVKELENVFKKLFKDKLKDYVQGELTVDVNIKVSYR